MVRKYGSDSLGRGDIEADVIVLGCSLPGIVTAHKLKRKFGDTMDIVVIDLGGPARGVSKCDVVAFLDEDDRSEGSDTDTQQPAEHSSRRYLLMYAKEFNITIPDAILTPAAAPSLHKLFEYNNGSAVRSANNFHDFDYLSALERFELGQYQRQIDESMRDLFRVSKYHSPAEQKKLLSYDQTTMESHIRGALLFPTSREIMRNMVRLVCGVAPDAVSVLFYLHQCYRNHSCREYLDGNNTRFREKLLGYCRKRLAHQLQRSVADITLSAKSIKGIRTHSREQVILETMKGENNYVCRLLAMALNPDQLRRIEMEPLLLSDSESRIVESLTPGRVRKFTVQYETDFWRVQGFSGEILSVRGPIVWAMERPALCATGRGKRYSYLVGYLRAARGDGDKRDSRREVTEQLVRLFGERAADQLSYKESEIEDVFVPKCGHYVALRRWCRQNSGGVEWAPLDVYQDGDVAAALEAGHAAYLRVASALRPQAQSFEDVAAAEDRSDISGNLFNRLLAKVNIVSGASLVAYTTAAYVCVRLVKSYFART
ncbi:unnamed protein product, partial [Iphiclides podalirius]